MKISLKTQNLPFIVTSIIFYFALYSTFVIGFENFWDNFEIVFSQFNLENSVTFAITPILVIILSGIVTPEIKAKLVYWKFKDTLPGYRVFSSLAKYDSRIDLTILEKKYGNLPIEPKDQNRLWYKIYREYDNSIIVKNSHKVFLLTRDLTSITFIFSFILSFSLFIHTGSYIRSLLFFSILFTLYIVISKASKNYGNRFCCNVLAEATINCS